MSHTYKHGPWRLHHNSDLSGDVAITNVETQDELVVVPAEVLVDFLASMSEEYEESHP